MNSIEIWSGEDDLINDMNEHSYEVESARLELDNSPQLQFDTLIANLKTETSNFKHLIISLAFTIIAFGLVLNLLLNVLVLCRKRSRQTTTTVFMLTMSLGYIVYLVLYALKVTAYLEGDNITKFHMYDIVDNWTHGQFLCRFTSSLPVFSKLIVRFSIFCIALKRLVKVFDCDCTQDTQSEDERDMLDDIDSNASKTAEYGMQHMRQSSTTTSTRTKKKPLGAHQALKNLFEWPGLLFLLAAIWLTSLAATSPLFTSYQTTTPIQNPSLAMCNSVFKFPEELHKVKSLYFNYLIYGTLIPVALSFICLLFILTSQLHCCRLGPRKTFSKSHSPSKGHSSTTNSSSSSSTSFTEEVASHQATCVRRSKENNCLVWLMLVVHLVTSLPQELYRYNQLSINFSDRHVLDEYLTSTLTEPVIKATPYYSFQLLYLAETALMPGLFLLFLVCSMRRSRPTRSESHSNMTKRRPWDSFCSQFRFGFLRRLLFDSELAESKKGGSFLRIYRRAASQHPTKHIFLPADQLVSDGQEMSGNKFPIVVAATATTTTLSTAGPNGVRTTKPFSQCNNNVMHIIQHPSWRINIKSQQQQQQQQQQKCLTAKQKACKNGVQLIGLN